MKKLNCYICDDCRRVLWHNGQIPPKDIVIIGKKHYCHTCSLEDKKAIEIYKEARDILNQHINQIITKYNLRKDE